MNNIAIASADDRGALFEETANRMGIRPLLIEKDFWVCWTLQQVFALPWLSEHLIFKGGTSLSKVFGLIKRFSEDIDLSLNRDFLGFGGDQDPETATGRKKKNLLEELQLACEAEIANEVLPALSQSFAQVLNLPDSQAGEWDLRIDPADAQNLLFTYPPGIVPEAGAILYVKPIVKLEFGARSDHWPAGNHEVVSYTAQVFPDVFQNAVCTVRVLEAERTFWEKATILHAEYYRPEIDDQGNPTKRRDAISRHYYDLVQLYNSPVGERAIANLELLHRVAEHKRAFFPSARARYQEAREGTLRLVPTSYQEAFLREDYAAMSEMFFPEPPPPTFDTILHKLRELEARINGSG